MFHSQPARPIALVHGPGRLGQPLREDAPAATEPADTRAGLLRVREDLFAANSATT